MHRTLLSRALQHVYCGKFDEALKELDLYSEASRAEMKAGFAGAIKKDYPEFATKLRKPGEKK